MSEDKTKGAFNERLHKTFEDKMFSDDYHKWVKQADLPPLTNTEHRFAEWLLLEENKKVIQQIGGLDKIFNSVRKYVKHS